MILMVRSSLLVDTSLVEGFSWMYRSMLESGHLMNGIWFINIFPLSIMEREAKKGKEIKEKYIENEASQKRGVLRRLEILILS